MDKNLKLLESEIKNLSFLLKIGNHNELIKRTSKLILKYPHYRKERALGELRRVKIEV